MKRNTLIVKLEKAHDRAVDAQYRWATAAAKHGSTSGHYERYNKAEIEFTDLLAKLEKETAHERKRHLPKQIPQGCRSE